MNILFVNPPAENTILEQTSDKKKDYEFMEVADLGSYPPLGMLYVASYLEKHTQNHKIHFIDCVGERLTHEELTEKIKIIKPDVLGVTSFTISLIDVVLVARNTKKLFPECHTCMGGHHPIAFPFEAAQLKEFDSIVVGEGELAFTELVNALDFKTDIKSIHGVYTKEKIEEFRNNHKQDPRFLSKVMVPPAYIENLDDLPMPNRKFISHIKYRNPTSHGQNLATVITTRGCPYKCTYCDVPYKKYRKRNIQHVLDEVQLCVDMGYDDVHFYDDLFNITPAKVIEFCDAVMARGIKFSWDFRGRVNSVTKESLIRAKEAGCRMISFGVETGTNEGLKIIKKGTTVEKSQEVFKWCRELEIRTVADFMIGFPFEKTEDDVRESIRYLIKLDPDFCLIAILMLLPNTEIYDQAVREKQADPDTWIRFALDPEANPDFRIDYWTENLSVDQLLKLRIEAYKSFYLRPKLIIRQLFRIRTIPELKNHIAGFFLMLINPDRENLWARKLNNNLRKLASSKYLTNSQ